MGLFEPWPTTTTSGAKVLRQADAGEEAGDAFGLFGIAETCACWRQRRLAVTADGRRVASGRSKASRRRRSSSPARRAPPTARPSPRTEGAPPASPAGRGGVPSRVTAVQAILPSGAVPRRRGVRRAPPRAVAATSCTLVVRRDHDGAQRARLAGRRCRASTSGHRRSRRHRRFRSRVDLPQDGGAFLLAVVHAEDALRSERSRQPLAAAVVGASARRSARGNGARRPAARSHAFASKPPERIEQRVGSRPPCRAQGCGVEPRCWASRNSGQRRDVREWPRVRRSSPPAAPSAPYPGRRRSGVAHRAPRFIKQAGEEIVRTFSSAGWNRKWSPSSERNSGRPQMRWTSSSQQTRSSTKPYGQVVGHRDRHPAHRRPGTGSAAASITPQEHAGPARKFEGQTFR